MGINNTEGYVAVWIGKFESKKEFKDYIDRHYEYEELEDIDSQFEKDFGLEYYDRDIVETSIKKNQFNTIKDLFLGASYLDEYIKELNDEEKSEFNVIIRIYDFKYEGKEKEMRYKDNILVFYNNIRYEKNVDLSWMGL